MINPHRYKLIYKLNNLIICIIDLLFSLYIKFYYSWNSLANNWFLILLDMDCLHPVRIGYGWSYCVYNLFATKLNSTSYVLCSINVITWLWYLTRYRVRNCERYLQDVGGRHGGKLSQSKFHNAFFSQN